MYLVITSRSTATLPVKWLTMSRSLVIRPLVQSFLYAATIPESFNSIVLCLHKSSSGVLFLGRLWHVSVSSLSESVSDGWGSRYVLPRSHKRLNGLLWLLMSFHGEIPRSGDLSLIRLDWGSLEGELSNGLLWWSDRRLSGVLINCLMVGCVGVYCFRSDKWDDSSDGLMSHSIEAVIDWFLWWYTFQGWGLQCPL